MRFKTFDDLRSFLVVARHNSLSAAAENLHLTKGALSQQIKRLETELGFAVFDRHPRGIKLTSKGTELLETAEQSFRQIETKVSQLAEVTDHPLTIGVTTYFASRWLSPRLMDFMQVHPEIRLRIQPMIDLSNFAGRDVDVAIRWGNGQWTDCEILRLLNCPAWPTGNQEAYQSVRKRGLKEAFEGFTLLRDREDSNAWSEWYAKAGLSETMRLDTLIIPDPNVRVQAVIDGQGVALNDDLITDEISNGRLVRLSPVELSDYGYFLAFEESAVTKPEVVAFIEWITSA
ncbi:MAG: LysR family transcriptional regulator [Pseudomonadota bacterium]